MAVCTNKRCKEWTENNQGPCAFCPTKPPKKAKKKVRKVRVLFCGYCGKRASSHPDIADEKCWLAESFYSWVNPKVYWVNPDKRHWV